MEDGQKGMKKKFNSCFFCILMLLWSCNNPLEQFSEYDGVNLIAYQFGEGGTEGWVADHSAPTNNYMAFETLAGPHLTTARNTPGLPDSGNVNVYRLEVKNQFINGDFEESIRPITAVSDIGGPQGALIWGTSVAPADDVLWIDTTTTGNQYLELHTISNPLYADLSAALSSYNDAGSSRYNFYIEFTISGLGIPFAITQTQPYIKFTFDTSTPGTQVARKVTLPLTRAGSRSFPGPYEGGTFNQWIKGTPLGNRLYLGPSDTGDFGATVDNIRFVRSDTDYAVRLRIPFTTEGRLDLPFGGNYIFSVYVLADPEVNTAPNRFASDTIAMEINSLYEDEVTSWNTFNRSSPDTSRWNKLTISTPGPGPGPLPADLASYQFELAISASDLDTATGGNPDTVYTLDAGSILIALPELYYSAAQLSRR